MFQDMLSNTNTCTYIHNEYECIEKYGIYLRNMMNIRTKILWVTRIEVRTQRYNLEIIDNEIKGWKEIVVERLTNIMLEYS